MNPSRVNVYINGNLIREEDVKGEHQGRTDTKVILPHDKLNLHGNGLTNRITLKFVSGAGVIFLDYFQVHAKIADMPAPAMGFPLIA